MPTTPTPLDCALAYASRGWHVFPVHTIRNGACSCGKPCGKPAGKHPRTAHGHKDATTDEQTIRTWWTQWPDANIGIATGEVSNLVVWDFDTYKPDAVLPEHLGDWPETLEVRSGGGGRQFYFQHAHTLAKGNDAFDAVDIKSDGGYVVAPPSVHRSGHRYEWVNEAEVAEMPPWLVCLEGKTRSDKCHRKQPGDWAETNDASSSTSTCAVDAQGCFRGFAVDLQLAKFLGLPTEFEGTSAIKCWCPLHDDGLHPSAWVRRAESGDIIFSCIHEGGWTLTLPQLYASLCTGTIVRFKDNGKSDKVSHVIWRLRLLHDAGLIQPLPREHYDVPADAPPSVPPVWRGFILLLGLKDHIPQWKGTPAAYSWRFIAGWCDVTMAEARYAMKWLIEHGYLEGTKLDKKVYGRAMEVFQPSTPVHELERMVERLTEGSDENDEDREPAAVSVVPGVAGVAEGNGAGDERGVQPERHPDASRVGRLQRTTPDPHARVHLRQVRKTVRGQVRAEVPPRVPQPDVEAASQAEVRAFWDARVPARVDPGAGDAHHGG